MNEITTTAHEQYKKSRADEMAGLFKQLKRSNPNASDSTICEVIASENASRELDYTTRLGVYEVLKRINVI